LGIIVHRGSLLRPSFTRHVSSKSTKPDVSAPQRPTSSLPPHKLRALISLYHQSRDFISPNNLSDKIDQVFATGFYSSNDSGLRFASYGNLLGTLRQRRSLPRIGESNMQTFSNEPPWSSLAKREDEVFHALYGVDNLKMPGLDALLDEEKKIQEMSKEDKETSS